MAVGGKRVRLGEILVRAGVLEEAQLNEALAKQKETKEPIGEILTKLGFVTEEKIKYALELQFGVKHVNLKQARIPAEVLKLLPEPLLKQYQMIPVAVNQLTVALVDPNNILAIDEIRKRLKGVSVVPAVCTESDFWETLKTIPKEGAAPAPSNTAGAANHLPEIPAATDAQLKDLLEKAAKGAGDAAMAPVVNAILSSAIKKRASTIFIEPMENEVILRYRVDGHMLREPGIAAKLGQSIISRIKVMAGLAVTAGNAPMNGTFAFNFENRPVKIAFHSMPARHGQVMTIRIFDSALLASQGLDNLVLNPRTAQGVRALLQKPSGLLLFAGPRGSGKTILQYACLKELKGAGASIMTIEDPIEFDLDGITQVPVSAEPGANDMSVLAGLNSALNQSPSAVMVSDVVEPAIAQRMVKGALAGTLVLGGLTTTQGALVEARETWDVPVRLIANSIAGLVTQRLVRRLCPSCKETYKPDEKTAAYFAKLNGTGDLVRAKGCENCYQTGFSGQVGVYEVIPFNAQIRELVARNAPKAHIDHLARQMGMLTLEDYAMWLVSQGHTTWDEIKKTDIAELAQSGHMAESTVPAAKAPTPAG